MGDIVNIAFATNRKFVNCTCIALYSLLENADKSRDYHVYVIAENLTTQDQNKLSVTSKSFPNSQVIFCNPKKFIEGYSFYVNGHFSKETYYRLILPDLLPDIDKILYLDSDLIVKKDISKLYDTNITGKLIAAIQDPDTAGLYNGAKADKKEYMDTVLKLKDPYSYFQAGVVIMNLAEFRKSYTTKQILDYSVSQEFQLLDQDILNHLCENKVEYIDMSWNVMVDYIGIRRSKIIELAPDSLKKAYDEARQHPAIIHYAGPEKPWINPGMDFAPEFWYYARKMPFYEEVLFDMVNHAAYKECERRKALEKHPVRDGVEKVRVASLKLVPEDNPARVAFKNFVKKYFLHQEIKK